MSNQLDEIARALYNGQLPLQWRRLAPDTLKSLGNWMIHFERRFRQVRAGSCVCVSLLALICFQSFMIVLYSPSRHMPHLILLIVRRLDQAGRSTCDVAVRPSHS